MVFTVLASTRSIEDTECHRLQTAQSHFTKSCLIAGRRRKWTVRHLNTCATDWRTTLSPLKVLTEVWSSLTDCSLCCPLWIGITAAPISLAGNLLVHVLAHLSTCVFVIACVCVCVYMSVFADWFGRLWMCLSTFLCSPADHYGAFSLPALVSRVPLIKAASFDFPSYGSNFLSHLFRPRSFQRITRFDSSCISTFFSMQHAILPLYSNEFQAHTRSLITLVDGHIAVTATSCNLIFSCKVDM